MDEASKLASALSAFFLWRDACLRWYNRPGRILGPFNCFRLTGRPVTVSNITPSLWRHVV